MERFACVTGADHGLGYAFAEGLLQRGYSVFAGLYRPISEELERLAENHPGKLLPLDLDISSDASVTAAAERIRETTDRLELLINNASILGDITATAADKLDFEQMKDVFNVNALGALRVSNALLPSLLRGESRLIVNISSEAGSIGTCWRDGWFAYCMSKAALNMQSAIVHNELRKSGGQAMVFHPGHVRTFMRGHLDETGSLTPAESAGHILGLIARHEEFRGEHPVFLSYDGTPMEW
ncbi:SDR family NAD(P)-dependent oxidoreductase [Cohnella fermenti]|uniref:SDR family NAD(P)-dependent oxidoreductase n=1 Tax=Cohnella fermenti TaxID=2565925 RepID=A0A4V3WFH6_9BACL|nr:SDR family NAD(P)-dependent oxidoreductase [Cohnella fermenti]THF80300.1 SDR family NAD(P)-dependent oxidoreductase [Cohnella fermenti]